MIELEKIVDHTRLTVGDKDNNIEDFLNNSLKNNIRPYNICVYECFINVVKKWENGNNIKVNIATVINFPEGENLEDKIIEKINRSLKNGADELDIVINFKEYIEKGESKRSIKIIETAREIAKDKVIKVIIECGELKESSLVRKATRDAINAGANFVKTSTGMHTNSTFEQCSVILDEIKKYYQETKVLIGFKISGGVRTLEDAMKYINLATKYLNSEYISPKTFRIGSSRLLKCL